MGLPATSGQHDVILLPSLTPRHCGSVVDLASMPQQQLSFQIPLQAYTNYAMGPSQAGFSFRVGPPTILYFCMSDVCSGVCFLLSGATLDAISPTGAQLLGFAQLQPFGACPGHAYVQPGSGHQPTPCMHRVAAPSTALSRGSLLLLSLLPHKPVQLYVGEYSFGSLAESQLIPPPSLHGEEVSFFQV